MEILQDYVPHITKQLTKYQIWDQEDIVQDILLQSILNWKHFKEGDKIVSFINLQIRQVLNERARLYKRLKDTKTEVSITNYLETSEGLLELGEFNDPNLNSRYVDELSDTINSNPYLKLYSRGYDIREISGMYNVSPQAVHKHLKRFRSQYTN